MPQMLVRSVRDEAKDIKTFELIDPQYGKLEAFNAGSHIEIKLPGNLISIGSRRGSRYAFCTERTWCSGDHD